MTTIFAKFCRYELESGANEWFCDDDETWHPRKPVQNFNDNNNYPKCRLSNCIDKTDVNFTEANAFLIDSMRRKEHKT